MKAMNNNPKLVAKYNPTGIKPYDLVDVRNRVGVNTRAVVSRFGVNERTAWCLIINPVKWETQLVNLLTSQLTFVSHLPID